MRYARTYSRAFTLLELVLVMVVICIALSLVAPSFRGFSESARLRNSAMHFLTATRYARTYAVTEGRICRLNLDTKAGTYYLSAQVEDQFEQLDPQTSCAATLPDGIHLSLDGRANDAPTIIDFYPNGRCQPATIRLSNRSGQEMQVACDSPAELFAIVTEGGGSTP